MGVKPGLTLREERRMRAFENRVLRIVCGTKKDEVTGEWRRLRNEELCDLYSSPNIRTIKSRRTRWAGHVARMGDRRSAYRVLVGRHEGNSNLKDPGVDGSITLKWIFKNWDGGA
jgi:hypothetical protein